MFLLRMALKGKGMLGKNSEAKAFKVSVEGETGDVVKKMNDYNIRYGVTKRNPFVLREFFEDFLCCPSYRIIIIQNKQGRFDALKKINGKMIACTVSQQSNGLADNIPSGVKLDRVVFTVFKDFTSPVIIRVVRS